jgi:hypothetical protein
METCAIRRYHAQTDRVAVHFFYQSPGMNITRDTLGQPQLRPAKIRIIINNSLVRKTGRNGNERQNSL